LGYKVNYGKKERLISILSFPQRCLTLCIAEIISIFLFFSPHSLVSGVGKTKIAKLIHENFAFRRLRL